MVIKKRFPIGMKMVCAAMTLAWPYLSASAQSVENWPVEQSQVFHDPSGIGQDIPLMFQVGVSTTQFSTGRFADTNIPYQLGGALAAFNTLGLQSGGLQGTTVSEQYAVNEYEESVRVGMAAATAVSSLDVRTDSDMPGAFQSLNTDAAITFSGTRMVGVLTGGSLQVNRLRISLSSGQVVADLSGTKAAAGTRPAVTYNRPDTVLWTFNPTTDVVGVTRLNPDSLRATDPIAAMGADGYTSVPGQEGTDGQQAFFGTIQVNNLSMTLAGAGFFIDSLGLLASGQDTLLAVNSSAGKWGSINTSLSFVTGVPEPSTYALMGLGLVGLSWLVKRKRVVSIACTA